MSEYGMRIDISCSLLHSADAVRSAPRTISVQPSRQYHIRLYDDIRSDIPLLDKTLDGLGNETFLLFNDRGRLVYDGFLPAEQGYILYATPFDTPDFSRCMICKLPLPQTCQGYSAYTFVPESPLAAICIGNHRFIPRFLLTSRLVDAEYLLGKIPQHGALLQANLRVDQGVSKAAVQI